MCLTSASACIHAKLKPTLLFPLLIFPFRVHECWLCGYSMPRRLCHKHSDKQTEPYEQASRRKQPSSQTSMGQTWLKSKQCRVFISTHQNPINSCFLGLRHTAGRAGISTASIIRQPTDDRTLQTLLRRFGLLHTADGVLGSVSLIVFLLCLPCMHTTNIHTHILHGLKQQCKPEDIQAWEIICQPFTPQHQICCTATARA